MDFLLRFRRRGKVPLQLQRFCRVTLTFFPGEVSLSGTTLVLRYMTETDTIKGGRIVLSRPDQRVLPLGWGCRTRSFSR